MATKNLEPRDENPANASEQAEPSTSDLPRGSKASLARSAQRALDIFGAFAKERRPLSISELARMLKIPVSTCHGLVKTLEQGGYLTEIKRFRGYYPTKLLLRQANEISRYDPVPALFIPHLAAARDEAGETVVLGKRVRLKAVYLEVLESAAGLRYIASVGDARPLHATAIGKALLGGMPPEEREKLVKQLKMDPSTPATITSRELLLEDVDEGLRRGWFSTDGEFLNDVRAVAIPVTVQGDDFGVVITGPRARMRKNAAKHGDILKRLKAALESSGA